MTDLPGLIEIIQREVSETRALDYVMRLWRYDKWSTLPMWQKSAKEAKAIMEERQFDEAEIVDTPADGVTRHGTWTNPIGWDVKQATLEVTEPADIPDEYRFLCNYRHNPTSLNNFSCPTPPEGIETELVLIKDNNPENFKSLNACGKIILVSADSRGMKRYLDRHGIIGIVSDEIEEQNRDFITANQWLNGWSDRPDGWLMSDADSKNNFGFSISQKKGNYLRNLLRQGIKVKVRAKIDSRYYTDDTLPYITGCIHGTGSEGEDVLIVGHIFEWGANDNATGAAGIIEALGTLNDLIISGKLPRPKRTIRMWLGHEMYGSLAYAEHNLERLRNKTIAVVCCDTAAADYDLSSTALNLGMNVNACPSFTDALFPDIARQYYERFSPHKLWRTIPFVKGMDNFFGEPMIGVPINSISMDNGDHLHHNSMDTIEKVDPRTLRELSILNASYLYFLADAGSEELASIAQWTFDRGLKVVTDKAGEMKNRLRSENDGAGLGKIRADGSRVIEYYTSLQKQALSSIERIVSKNNYSRARKHLSHYSTKMDEFGSMMVKHFCEAVKEKAKEESITIIPFIKKEGTWESKAKKIIPKRKEIGTLMLDGIQVEEWKEVKENPRWWEPTNWASASYWWCDGKRNLKEIKELLELEAGVPVENFDLIAYYSFLEKYGFVEFV